MNKICLVGNMTKEIEIRNTTSGKAVGSFNLAVRRDKDNTDFIPCVAWEKTAELLAQYTTKGTKIAVEGRLQSRSYENKEGKKIFVLEVMVSNIDLVEKRKSDAEVEETKTKEVDVDKVYEDFGNSVELTDDDIAF